MWDENDRRRLAELRQREVTLTEGERAELAQMMERLEAAERAYLAPATERMRQEREKLETENGTLAGLISRKEALVRRLQNVLAESQAERRAIESELAEVLAGSAHP